jgi:hypothetical protein
VKSSFAKKAWLAQPFFLKSTPLRCDIIVRGTNGNCDIFCRYTKVLLALLFAKDKYTTGNELFQKQQWTVLDIGITLLLMESYPFYLALAAYLFSKIKIDLRSAILSLSESQLAFLIYVIALFLLVILFKLKFKKRIEVLGINKNNLWKNIYLGIFVGLICFLMIDGTTFLFSKTFKT